MDEEYEEIVLLEEFNEALLGCVYSEDGTPLPCYSAKIAWSILSAEGYTEEEADDYVEGLTAGMTIVWIHPLELQPEFEPDTRPHLRLVH